MLYLVPTPIGNLGDITYRAVEVLHSCDLILCEDTRRSRILLKHYHIDTPLKSYHKFSEAKLEGFVLDKLQSGVRIGLISDAGTPGIADPGMRLVKRCLEEGIEVDALPGACAALVALTSSGLNAERFQFLGFLPKKKTLLESVVLEAMHYPGTSICYESPHRLMKTLVIIEHLAPTHTVVIARELTKKFQEITKGVAVDLLSHYDKSSIKGEIVVLIEGKENCDESDATLSVTDHVAHIQKTLCVSQKEAIKIVAEIRREPKRAIYAQVIKNKT